MHIRTCYDVATCTDGIFSFSDRMHLPSSVKEVVFASCIAGVTFLALCVRRWRTRTRLQTTTLTALRERLRKNKFAFVPAAEMCRLLGVSEGDTMAASSLLAGYVDDAGPTRSERGAAVYPYRSSLAACYDFDPSSDAPPLRSGTRREPFNLIVNFTPMGVNSISFGYPHVRPMGRTCGEPNEIKKIT